MFDRISVQQISCLSGSGLYSFRPLLHACQVGLWERTAKYEVFILSVPEKGLDS